MKSVERKQVEEKNLIRRRKDINKPTRLGAWNTRSKRHKQIKYEIGCIYICGTTEGYNALVPKKITTDISASLNHLQTFIFTSVSVLFFASVFFSFVCFLS